MLARTPTASAAMLASAGVPPPPSGLPAAPAGVPTTSGGMPVVLGQVLPASQGTPATAFGALSIA